MATLGDTFRAYIKPSLGGILVLRKRNSIQTSGRVKKSQERVGARKPSKAAHDACVSANKARNVRVYVPGKGYEEQKVCPIQVMKGFLRKEMKSAHGAA